jgi:hypothetical protein
MLAQIAIFIALLWKGIFLKGYSIVFMALKFGVWNFLKIRAIEGLLP